MAENGHNRSASSEPKTNHDWHLWHVFHDDEFHRQLAALHDLEKEVPTDENLAAMKQELATSFHIKIEELNQYEISKVLHLEHNERTTALDWDTVTMRGTISFDMLATSQAELLEQFKAVEQLREVWKVKPKRRRASDDHVLIYAIFKSRQHHKTYRQIYDLYRTGNLAGYDGVTNQFGDEELLERYYRLYQP